MDEFSLHKEHRYATVVFDVQRMRVLWVGQGNGRAAIRSFFQLLVEMNTAMGIDVRQYCPSAGVVCDLFHVVARFRRKVVDRVRVDQANIAC
ncbi:hypothetical protein BZG29_13585 [Janthinobacterium sp. LM6]|nr:hypothetical protein BZG29_13585 [Janthinobacterium sp. LM6]